MLESEKIDTYHLLTYKDTKIVHSLFPDKKTYNKKPKTKYGKGFVSTKTKFPEAYNDLIVPYENEKGKVVYSILIRKFYNEGIERTFIQKHNISGIPESRYQLAERTFTDYESFD
ncbi:MAG: hypothetical protein JNM51_16795, partial [Bacteroidia bacterium]|nr:hypothetical protein [Bacteroidia bacterium]